MNEKANVATRGARPLTTKVLTGFIMALASMALIATSQSVPLFPWTRDGIVELPLHMTPDQPYNAFRIDEGLVGPEHYEHGESSVALTFTSQSDVAVSLLVFVRERRTEDTGAKASVADLLDDHHGLTVRVGAHQTVGAALDGICSRAAGYVCGGDVGLGFLSLDGGPFTGSVTTAVTAKGVTQSRDSPPTLQLIVRNETPAWASLGTSPQLVTDVSAVDGHPADAVSPAPAMVEYSKRFNVKFVGATTAAAQGNPTDVGGAESLAIIHYEFTADKDASVCLSTWPFALTDPATHEHCVLLAAGQTAYGVTHEAWTFGLCGGSENFCGELGGKLRIVAPQDGTPVTQVQAKLTVVGYAFGPQGTLPPAAQGLVVNITVQ